MKINKAERLKINEIAASYGFAPAQVDKMIQSQYDFIRSTLRDLKLPKDLSEEEFYKATKNFNIPAIGKLFSSYPVYKKLNKL